MGRFMVSRAVSRGCRSGQSQKKSGLPGCDVVYGTNNEFGFDYLRDNMAFSMGDKVGERWPLPLSTRWTHSDR